MSAEEYRCRECQMPLRYLGWGRPPVWCEAHRPVTSPPLRHQLNGGVYEPSLPGFPDPVPTRYTEVVAHRRRVSGPVSEPLSRSTDPETSRNAAPHDPKATEAAILRVLQGPLTAEEIADRLPELRKDSVITAVSRLKNAGMVRDTGEKRLSSAGRPRIVWEAA